MADINYSNRDFLSIRQDLFRRAETVIPEWTSRDSSDFAVALVDLWSYMGDVLHYYIDRAAREAFITTATQREAMLSIANLFDYHPTFQTAATAEVTVVGSNIPTGEVVEIPAGTVFVAPAFGDSPVVYFTSTDSASAAAASSAVVLVVEGEQINDETLGTSNGLANQRFTLFYPNVIGDSVEVFVNEGTVVNGSPSAVQYQYIEKLFNATANDRFFSLIINANNEMEIVFGNGVNGKIPNSGQSITVNYRIGAGADGNVAANRINQIVDSPSPYISQIYSTAATGGADAESIESLRVNIPAAFSTQDRAVSLNDYKSLALSVAGVAKATASYNSSTSTVTIYAAPFTTDYLNYGSGSLSVSSALRDSIVTYYEPRQMIGASVTAASAIALTSVNITAEIHVLDGYVASTVSDNVEKALDNLFKFDAVFFNQTLSKGLIYRTIMAVAGVDYVTISIPSTETVSSGTYGLLKKGTYTLSTVGGITGS